MTREELTGKILDAKRRKRLAWKQIAEAIGPGSPDIRLPSLAR
jgi:cyanate lyase